MNKNGRMAWLAALVMAAAWGGGIGAQAADQPAARQAAAWFLGSDSMRDLDLHLLETLQAEGFAAGAMAHPGLSGQTLQWDELKRYNVLVLNGLGKANADGSLDDRARRNLELATRFLNEGGGVLFLPGWCQMQTLLPPQTAFLEALGLTPLFDELVVDPDHATKATAFELDFACTANVANTPLTKGVSRLWYPADVRRIGGQTHTTTFLTDDAWTVAIAGEKSATTISVPLTGVYRADHATPGRIASAPPLVAYRQVGKGRIVCLGIASNYLFKSCARRALQGIVLDAGLRRTPSDGQKLIVNALHWLAEPSLAENTLGGATMDKVLLRDPLKTQFCAPFAWDQPVPAPPVLPAREGLIGARTRYSSGQGTVAEWIAAAKAKGLSFLVFLEDFRALSKTSFEALKRECAASTDTDFAAIPGFTIDDEIGNHYFYFGTAFPYPPADFLSADGQTFVSRDPGLAPSDPRLKGQLAMTTLDYAYTLAGFKLTAGNYFFQRDAAPFANFFSNFDAAGVVTAVDGKVEEEALADYLAIADFGQGPLPLALNLMSEPAQLAGAPWRTVLRTKAPAGEQLAAYWSSWHFYPDNPTRIYITAGPRIDNWSFTGPRDYEGANRGDFVWQNQRWQVHAQVSSDLGLRSVTVYDGPERFRRFLPGGAKQYAFQLELNHDKQHNLVLVAEDWQGHRAVSGEQWDRNHRLEEFNCADRNNQLTYGYASDAGGRLVTMGGNQTLASPNKRVAGAEIAPAFVFRNDPRLGQAAFDGGVSGAPPFLLTPRLLPREGGALKAPDVAEAFRSLHSGDVNLGEGRWDHVFADNVRVANVWHTLWRTTPAADFSVVHRRAFFQIDPDQPLAVFLERTTLTLKRDLPNRGAELGLFRTDKAENWVLRGSDGSVYCGTWEAEPRSPARQLTVPFASGAYAALLNSGLGGAVLLPLTDNLEVSLSLPTRANANFRFQIAPAACPQRAGESVTVSFLLLGPPATTATTRSMPEATNELVETFRRQYGLAGDPPGYTVRLDTGRVVSARYPLDVDGSREGGMAGELEGRLCSTLPVRVGGLHDAWSAYLYDGNARAARPLGVFEGAAWATLPMHGKGQVFIGHPVTVDVEGVTIQVVQTGAGTWSVEFHNPGDAAIVARPRLNPRFPPLAGCKLPAGELNVPPGQSVFWRLE